MLGRGRREATGGALHLPSASLHPPHVSRKTPTAGARSSPLPSPPPLTPPCPGSGGGLPLVRVGAAARGVGGAPRPALRTPLLRQHRHWWVGGLWCAGVRGCHSAQRACTPLCMCSLCVCYLFQGRCSWEHTLSSSVNTRPTAPCASIPTRPPCPPPPPCRRHQAVGPPPGRRLRAGQGHPDQPHAAQRHAAAQDQHGQRRPGGAGLKRHALAAPARSAGPRRRHIDKPPQALLRQGGRAEPRCTSSSAPVPPAAPIFICPEAHRTARQQRRMSLRVVGARRLGLGTRPRKCHPVAPTGEPPPRAPPLPPLR